MSGIVVRFGASVVAGMALVATVGLAQEKVTFDQLPKKVQEIVKARFPGAEFTSILKETADGKVIYDLEMKFKGKKTEMDVREDGTIIDIQKEIEAKDLPAAVTKSLEAKYPKAKILEVGEISLVKDNKEEKVDHYEVILETAEKKKLEVEVALDGKIVKEEELK